MKLEIHANFWHSYKGTGAIDDPDEFSHELYALEDDKEVELPQEVVDWVERELEEMYIDDDTITFEGAEVHELGLTFFQKYAIIELRTYLDEGEEDEYEY